MSLARVLGTSFSRVRLLLSLMMARSFVLADTDRLHAKIVGMSDRIRQLEDALSTLNTGSSEPHPLLTRDLLEIKSMIDLHSAVDRPPPDETQPDADDDASDALDIFGTLAVREGGGSTFYGRSAGQEVRALASCFLPCA